MAGLLSKSRIVAKPGYNRWLIAPAAIGMHLCIGSVYAWSLFNPALIKRIGVVTSAADDWNLDHVVIIFSVAILCLGLAAAIAGRWLEKVGPRMVGVVAACCWGGGFIIGSIGIVSGQLWLLYLGYGVIGGIGLGLGYVSPVSTLIRWFPDRRGMATGMAIMGFGGGAMIGAPLGNLLMEHFSTRDSVGVWQTFVVLGIIYFLFMMGGAFGYRIPPPGWRPDDWEPPKDKAHAMTTNRHVHLKDAHKTKQFWLIWLVLALNVIPGIGVLSMASPMLQEIFGGSLIGASGVPFDALSKMQHEAVATIAAGFAGLLSLFNIAGRFFWASLSDKIGRKVTYFTFFALGIALYAAAPPAAHAGSQALFVLFFCVILSMYGGGFATVPAYLADIFGTQFVGAIHGRLLTAWSVAGVIGPSIVSYIRDGQIALGVHGTLLYDLTMYILAGMLAIGFLCNMAIKPVHEKLYMSDKEVAEHQAKTHAVVAGATSSYGIGRGGLDVKAFLAWTVIALPIAWGTWVTLQSAFVLFR